MIISIGIHIQDHVLTIVEVLQQGKTTKVGDMATVPLEPKATEVQKRTIIIDHLNQLVEKHQKESYRFCFTLPQSQISAFQATFPFREKFKILKTIPFEIENTSPFHLDEVLFDIRFSMNTQKNQSDIMCLLTSKDNVTNFLDSVKKARLSPYLLSTDGAAIANLIEGWNPDFKIKIIKNRKETLYIHLGYNESFALFFYDKKLKHISSISWGFKPIIQAMIQRYQLSHPQAQKEFIDKAFILSENTGTTQEQKFFSTLIKKEIEPLVDKLKILKLSLETNGGHKVQDGFILGPGSVIQNLSSFLSSELSFPIRRMQKTAQSPDLDLFNPSSHHFLVAFGVALEGFKRPPYEGLNLIRSLKNNMGFFFFQKKWKQIFTYAFALFIIFTSYSLIRDTQSQNIADKTNELFVDFGKKIALLPIRKTNLDNVKEFLNVQESIKENRKFITADISQPQPIDRLKTLTQKIDKKSEWNLKITLLEIEDDKIHMEGYMNENFVNDLESQLKQISKKGIVKITKPKPQLILPSAPDDNLKIEKGEIEKGEIEKGEIEKGKLFSYSFNLRDDL